MTASASNTVQPVNFESPRRIEPEDQVRADFYALLANVFYRAPDARLLQAMVVSAEPAGEAADDLSRAWNALAAAYGESELIQVLAIRKRPPYDDQDLEDLLKVMLL